LSIKLLLIFLVIFIKVNIVYSQPITWIRTLGGYRDDKTVNTFESVDGNYIMIGEKIIPNANTGNPIVQTYIVKFNKFGDIIWEKIWICCVF
jgi:hypothetical protein